MSDEFDDLFTGGGKGPASAKLSQPGDAVQGIIFKRQRLEEKDDDGNVVLNKWGKPKPLVVLWLATSLRDPEIEDDDGARRVWLKGNGLWTLQDFITQNGMKPPAFGGKTKIWVDSLQPNAIKTRKPMKVHGAMYADPKPEWKLIAQEYLDRWEKPKRDEFDDSFDTRPAGRAVADEFGANQGAVRNQNTLDAMRGFDDDEPPF